MDIQLATRYRAQVALTLSDSFCVDRHRDSFLALIGDGVDVLFANEAELLSLCETTSFADAMAAVAKDCTLAAVNRSENGSAIVAEGTVTEAPAQAVDEVVDTTGAGDLYAAGCLFGLARDKRSPSAPGSGMWQQPKSSRTSARGRGWRSGHSSRVRTY